MKNHKHDELILVILSIISTILSTLMYEKFLTTLSVGDGVIWIVSTFPLFMLLLTAHATDEYIATSKELQKVSDKYIETLNKGYNQYRELLYTILKPPNRSKWYGKGNDRVEEPIPVTRIATSEVEELRTKVTSLETIITGLQKRHELRK